MTYHHLNTIISKLFWKPSSSTSTKHDCCRLLLMLPSTLSATCLFFSKLNRRDVTSCTLYANAHFKFDIFLNSMRIHCSSFIAYRNVFHVMAQDKKKKAAHTLYTHTIYHTYDLHLNCLNGIVYSVCLFMLRNSIFLQIQ